MSFETEGDSAGDQAKDSERERAREEFKSMDFYARLGLARRATADDIRVAFRRLSRMYHPDVAGDEEMFKLLLEAYSGLGGRDKGEMDSRTRYDRQNPRAGLGKEKEQISDGVVVVKMAGGIFSFYDSKGNPISQGDALATGIVLPQVVDGHMRITMRGMTVTQSVAGTMTLTFQDGQLISSRQGHHGERADVGVGGPSQEIKNGGRIVEGNHTVDVSRISTLDRISGGVVSIVGNGTITLDRISGGVVNIAAGVIVRLNRISGGVVNVSPGAQVIVSDRLSGGVVNGRGRIQFSKNSGAIVN